MPARQCVRQAEAPRRVRKAADPVRGLADRPEPHLGPAASGSCDFHYAQGDGEVAGMAIEMGGRMTVTARIVEDPPNLSHGPHYEGPASVLRIPSERFYAVTGFPLKEKAACRQASPTLIPQRLPV